MDLSRGDQKANHDCKEMIFCEAYGAGPVLHSTGKVIALDASIVLNQFRAATPSLR